MRSWTKTKIKFHSHYPDLQQAMDDTEEDFKKLERETEAAFANMNQAFETITAIFAKTAASGAAQEREFSKTPAALDSTRMFRFKATSWSQRWHLAWTFLWMSAGMFFRGRTSVSLRSK